ncbi:MAG TPA: HAD-IIIA family hydrolase [Acidimicrobiales bacterium]
MDAYDVVVPTIGRPSLHRLLDALANAFTRGPAPRRVVLVDDRPPGAVPLDVAAHGSIPLVVLASGGRGPAAARNTGWRHGDAPWVAFLDDDVVPARSWAVDLRHDLASLAADVAGVSGRIAVPLPEHRKPTDRERDVAGLADASWATADMAYRRRVLEEADGFDDRFPRAYREDAELAIRVLRAGYRLARGRRVVVHPVGAAPWHVSVQRQRNNADDALLTRLHGTAWMRAAGAVAAAALATRRPRVATIAFGAWLASAADFAAARIRSGPAEPREVAAMVATSVMIPPAATAAWLAGVRRAARLAPVTITGAGALLFDRDGTLIEDVGYNGDEQHVRPLPGVRDALDRARRRGVPLAIVTNQSGIGRGLLTTAQVDAVNRRVQELLGPFDAIVVCPHHPDAGCDCRKPRGAMIREAAERLGVAVDRMVMIGDIGADVDAARDAGAAGILVPQPATLAHEVAAAPAVAPDFGTAVTWALGGRRAP